MLLARPERPNDISKVIHLQDNYFNLANFVFYERAPFILLGEFETLND